MTKPQVIDGTKLSLTGIFSGLRLTMSGVSEFVSRSASVTTQTGYKIGRGETKDGVAFDIISVAGGEDDSDSANVVISVEYSQEEAFREVDLDVRYTDIPAGSHLEIASTERQFAINRQGIGGSASVGKQGTDLGRITASLDLRLWVPDAAGLKSSSSLVMSFSKIVPSGGGPVKKVLLQKIQVDLFDKSGRD